MKTCDTCSQQCNDKDFYFSDSCYKCIFKKKTQKKKKMVKKLLCKICSISLDGMRRVYCSDYCAAVGKNKLDKSYWVRHVIA